MTDAAAIKAMAYPDLRNWWVQQPENGGWVYKTYEKSPGGFWDSEAREMWSDDHPLPDTLDAVAGCIPSEWDFEIHKSQWWTDPETGAGVRKIRFQAIGVGPTSTYEEEPKHIWSTERETLACAMLELACLALVAMRSNKQ